MTILAIEGGDAAGKNTLCNSLVQHMKADWLRVEMMSFPVYATETGQLIKRILTGEVLKEDPGRNLALQSLMVCNRHEHYDKLVAYLRDPQKLLILDRYWLSALIYGTADGLDPFWLLSVHQALPKPHLTLLIEASVEEGMRRRPERRDMYEKNLPFLERVRQDYLTYFNERAKQGDRSFRILDGHKAPEFVLADAIHIIENSL